MGIISDDSRWGGGIITDDLRWGRTGRALSLRYGVCYGVRTGVRGMGGRPGWGYGFWPRGVGVRFKPLDTFVMPNHVHGILLIDKPMDAPPDATPSPIVETIDWLRRVREVGKRLFGYAGMVENKTLPLYLLVSLFCNLALVLYSTLPLNFLTR